jgi:hypothetical protein
VEDEDQCIIQSPFCIMGTVIHDGFHRFISIV